MRAVIISNGSMSDYGFIGSMLREGDFIIAADGALRHCTRLGVQPQLWIGDNDSSKLADSELEQISQSCRVIRLNPVKDATDTESACNYVLENGFDSVLLLGAIGSRFDHTLANVYLLNRFAECGIEAKIADEHNMIFFAGEHNVIDKSVYDNVSVIPIEGDVTDITNRGFYYPLSNERLAMYSSRGVSNRLTADSGEITVRQGKALIILSRD